MKTLILIVVGLVAIVVVLALIVTIAGSMLPRNHTASRSVVLSKPPAEVYAVVRDFGSAAKWRRDLKAVEVMPQPNGKIHFREDGKHGTVNFELAEDIAGQRIVTRILDTDLGYSGRWTYTFNPEGNGTRLTITEDGEVSNVIFRFMSRYIFGHTSTIDSYLTSLAAHFKETTRPQ